MNFCLAMFSDVALALLYTEDLKQTSGPESVCEHDIMITLSCYHDNVIMLSC
jgi:hypothetical protein